MVRLPELYRGCEDMLVNRPARGIERVRGGVPGGVTLNDALVSARSDMLSIVSSWAGLVADERPVSAPPRRNMPELTRFLLAHLRWLARHSAINDAVCEIVDVVKAAEHAIEPRRAPGLELGSCDKPGCGGIVYAAVGAATGPTRVSCERGHLWRPNEWLFLGHRLDQAGGGRPAAAVNNGEHAA